MKKIYFVGFVVFMFFIPLSTTHAEPPTTESMGASVLNGYKMPSVFLFNNRSIIENYTWAFMRYDHPEPSINFGEINDATPSIGSILIPANMMSEVVCKVALQVYRDSELETLHALDAYDSENMIHTADAFFQGKDEWNTDLSGNYRKESAVEMKALGDICLKANLVGECYAEASFNTAVLRLCGFSAEQVFIIGLQGETGGHGVNIVQADGHWYVFDSTFAPYVRNGMRDSLIFPIYYRSPVTDYIFLLENDKYLVNFGVLFPEYVPALKDPYNNMDAECLINIIEHVRPLFNNSFLGREQWNLSDFIEQASPHPLMKTVEIPYTVKDAVGTTLEEKTDSLVALIKDFVWNQAEESVLNQYDKSRFALGSLAVEYPQVYAFAAKLAAWTSKFGVTLDRSAAQMDVILTGLWIRTTISNKKLGPDNCVVYPDLLYLRHAGSSIDKAVLAYGTLCNMKKGSEFWSPEDLFVLITDDQQGYLAVRLNDKWKYLSFNGGEILSDTAPDEISMVFNENKYSTSWIP